MRYRIHNLIDGSRFEAELSAADFARWFPRPAHGHPERRIAVSAAIGGGNTYDPVLDVVHIPAVPLLDEDGQPVLDELGEPVIDTPARTVPLREHAPHLYVATAAGGELLPAHDAVAGAFILPAWHVVTVEDEATDTAYAAELRERRRQAREDRIQRRLLRKLVRGLQQMRDAAQPMPAAWRDIVAWADQIDADQEPTP